MGNLPTVSMPSPPHRLHLVRAWVAYHATGWSGSSTPQRYWPNLVPWGGVGDWIWLGTGWKAEPSDVAPDSTSEDMQRQTIEVRTGDWSVQSDGEPEARRKVDSKRKEMVRRDSGDGRERYKDGLLWASSPCVYEPASLSSGNMMGMALCNYRIGRESSQLPNRVIS